MPSIYWSNIVKNQWMAHNKARAEAAIGEWTSSLLGENPEFNFQHNKIESISPEVLLLEQKYRRSTGGAFYIGTAKLLENRFCYGIELKAMFKRIYVKRNEQNKELLNADDTFIVYQKHHLMGKI
ncbi:MAG: hypothetical protein LBJ89_01110, partial [Holosporales bacterium]|nr:hypothetical protein [Holosporales bacterium]